MDIRLYEIILKTEDEGICKEKIIESLKNDGDFNCYMQFHLGSKENSTLNTVLHYDLFPYESISYELQELCKKNIIEEKQPDLFCCVRSVRNRIDDSLLNIVNENLYQIQ